MIYYDNRIEEWVKDLDTSFLAPELYFEVFATNGDYDIHEFYVEGSRTEKFTTKSSLIDFNEKYNSLCKKYHKDFLIRKSWGLSPDRYKQGLKYYNLEE